MTSKAVGQKVQEKASTFKGMRFCTECDNMMEPKEYKSEEG